MHDIAARYADKVTPEYRAALQAIGLCRELLNQHREQYEKLLEGKRYMDNVGGLLDPTLYRDMLYCKGFEQQLTMARAALAFLKDINAIANEV